MKIDALASYPHYADHLWPVWEQLPEDVRGTFYSATRRPGAQTPVPARWGADGPVLVAGWIDVARVQGRPVIFLEHGAGQSYGGDPATERHGSYSGGHGLDAVRLFLCPSERVADRWRRTYPQTPAVVVGCPRLDTVRRKHPQRPVVAVTFHWDLVPEGQQYSGPAPTGASVRTYEGPVVELIVDGSTARVTVSPDHPVLTGRGWVRAGEVQKGDYLVRRPTGERHVHLSPDDDLPPTRVEDVAGALLEPLKVLPGVMPSSTPHLDYQRIDEQIDVVGADGFLRNGVTDASIHKQIDHAVFEGALLTHVGLPGGGSLAQLVPSRAGRGPGFVMPTADQDPARLERPVDGRSPDAEQLRQFVSGGSVEISLHKVVDVRVREYRGHGYDFTTVPRWYEVNGFVVHNCPLIPETRSALDHFDRGLPALVAGAASEGWDLLGHAHPRTRRRLQARWAELNVRYEPSADQVLRVASVVVADNTSLMWEAAALDIPLVVLDAPWYRRDVDHGLRFWEFADAGVRVSDPALLRDAVRTALADEDVERSDMRRDAALAVYSRRDGQASRRAAQAILAVLEDDMAQTTQVDRGPQDPQIEPELDHFVKRLRMLGATNDEVVQVVRHWDDKDDEEWTPEARRQLLSASDGHLRAMIEDIREEYPFEPERPPVPPLDEDPGGQAMNIWQDDGSIEMPDFFGVGVREILGWVKLDPTRASMAREWELETAQKEDREPRKSLLNRLEMTMRGGGR